MRKKLTDNNVKTWFRKKKNKNKHMIFACIVNIIYRIKIDAIINGINNGKKYVGNIIVYKKMPYIYKKIGIKEVELLISPNKIRTSVLTKNIAEKAGFSIGDNDNYHGLGKAKFNKALNDIYDPVMIIKENDNKIIVLTEQFINNNEIIIPIEINAPSVYANSWGIYNVTKTIYGKKGIYNYLNNLLKNGASVQYLNNKKAQKLIANCKVQYPASIISMLTNNISKMKI